MIKLEWKKNNIAKYMRGAVILATFLCLFVFALAFLGIANDPDGTLDAAEGMGTITCVPAASANPSISSASSTQPGV